MFNHIKWTMLELSNISLLQIFQASLVMVDADSTELTYTNCVTMYYTIAIYVLYENKIKNMQSGIPATECFMY